jgi:hypothetical protein
VSLHGPVGQHAGLAIRFEGRTLRAGDMGERRVSYTLADDGLFLEQVADCPSCARNLAATREHVAAGELGFAL